MPFSLSSLFVAGVNAIGFSPGGVVAGSPGALWQSSIGNVAPGSPFALLQSIGTSGGSAAAGATWSVVAGFSKAALTWVGFGPGGVVAGSPAALWQSRIGNVAPGSWFALLQSIGASGSSAAAGGACSVLTWAGFGPGGVVAGSLAALWQSSIVNVATGSLLASLQSIGASGSSTAAGGAVGVAPTIGGSVFARLMRR